MGAQIEKKPMIEVQGVTINHGIFEAISNVNIHVYQGEIVGLLGPNGAGKTTLIHAITGILPLNKGQIIFNGQVINGLPPERIVRAGITLVPEGRMLFNKMRTLENLELGAYYSSVKGEKKDIKRRLANVYKIFPILKEKEKEPAGGLSGGMQQMLAIGRGLMANPQLLVLDEPTLGLAPILIRVIISTLEKLREEQQLTILLAEQNAEATLKIVNRSYLMKVGKIVLGGSREEFYSKEWIKKVYLT
jgi:branched-chain amino acid transport system ATP-binding protein